MEEFVIPTLARRENQTQYLMWMKTKINHTMRQVDFSPEVHVFVDTLVPVVSLYITWFGG